MAALTPPSSTTSPLFRGAKRDQLRLVGGAALKAYAHLLFSRSPLVGALLMLATLTVPRAFAGGLLSVLAALLTAWALDFDRESVLDGSHGVSALLLGLGVAQWFGLNPIGLALIAVFAPLSVLLGAALRSSFAASQLPVLSMPFLGAFFLLLGLCATTAVPYAAPGLALPLPPSLLKLLPAGLELLFSSIGSLFFLPRPDAGLIILIALAVHSRIAIVLAAIALGCCLLLRPHVPLLLDEGIFHSLAYNTAFTALALGGVWFVPSPSSFLLALGGVLLCVLITVGGIGPLGKLGLPLLIVPFNATILTILLAMRQRTHDRRPKSVDFAPGTPEQNLAYFRTRRARFQAPHPVPIQLPVRGAWICTQGVDGPLTHRERWRYAFDFEIFGENERPFAGEGAQLLDYYAYRLPVLAPAAGTVIKVVNDVPDNEPGSVNLEQNWGNLVIVQHGIGLYSMVAHLAVGSAHVYEGQVVRVGEVLGLCGNSGRSSQPHVHFQLQSGPQPGDATVPCRFADTVRLSAQPPRLVAALCPDVGDRVRNLDPNAERAAFFQFPYRAVWTLRGGAVIEHIHSDIDLYGQLLLRSREHRAALYYQLDAGFFTAYDLVGAPDSALHLVRAALSRVPFEENSELRWTDLLPARMFRGRLRGALMDLVSPFLPLDSIQIEYRAERADDALIVHGESTRRDRQDRPLVKTRAELRRGLGITRLSVSVRGEQLTLEQSFDAPSAAPERPAPSPISAPPPAHLTDRAA